LSGILYEEAERHADKGHVTKTVNFLIPRWRTAAILKIVSVDNSASDRLISANFYKVKQNGVLKKDCDKNCRFRKSKMADDRHFEIVKAPYLNENFPILKKFCLQKRISLKMIVISPKF